MPRKSQDGNKPQRLAQGISKIKAHERPQGRGKNPARTQSRGHAGRAVANARDLSPLARLVQSLGEEGIRFQMVGMSRAIVQGVPTTTTDTGIWMDLPQRQYIRLPNLVMSHGGTPLARPMYALSDGSLVNFIFSMTGLKTFAEEYRQSREITWNRLKIRVLPLERIYESKKASTREKDIAHLPLLRCVMRGHSHGGTSPSGRNEWKRRKR